MSESSLRSFTKAITWRIVGSLSTTAIAWTITGELVFALEIGIAQLIVNLLLYWAHERVWNLTNWQRNDK